MTDDGKHRKMHFAVTGEVDDAKPSTHETAGVLALTQAWREDEAATRLRDRASMLSSSQEKLGTRSVIFWPFGTSTGTKASIPCINP